MQPFTDGSRQIVKQIGLRKIAYRESAGYALTMLFV